MSNYSVVGGLSDAASGLYRAADSIRYAEADSPDGKLRDRILRAQATIERIEKAAKGLIPGGFQSVPNAREEDKRAQREGR